MASLRLDRFIGNTTGLSRSHVHRAIRRGEVSVDGVAASDAGLQVSPSARVEFQGRTLTAFESRYFMLNKPIGFVCSTEDPTHRTVLQLLDVLNPAKLHIAGRLDVDATGLVLITDDGEWSHRVTSPRHQIAKIYRVTLNEPLSDIAIAALQTGIQLKGEPRPCQPAAIERVENNQARVTITEGKYHQVKRMFAAVGNSVTTLHREQIGELMLDPVLASGAYRSLTSEEISYF